MPNHTDCIRLKQKDFLEDLFKKKSITEMVTVYYSKTSSDHSCGIYCALIPNNQKTKCLEDFSWDLHHGNGYPEAIVYNHGDSKNASYHRYGTDKGIEPLVIDRDFYGIRPEYREINEEFRLFHRLYHDLKENRYIKIDERGNEEEVIIVEPNRIRIRLKEIRQFLAVKEMHLSIQFDCSVYSREDLNNLGLAPANGRVYRDEQTHYSLGFGEAILCTYTSFSHLMGKYFITPLPKSKSGMWGFSQEKKKEHAEFIIGVDEDGENILHTSNPDTLANFFGANRGAPNYLTAVYFRKTVLDKYYKQPSKYTIQDNHLFCGSLWGLQIDNHHSDKVCVWLGDLGRDLSYEEQLYWKSHNIAPVGTISETYFKRQLLAQFAESQEPDHIFQNLYTSLQRICSEVLTWQLLLPLNPEDSYHLSSIRIPATEEQNDFDQLILALTKILIDSLNEKKLITFISAENISKIKGSISRLEYVLNKFNIDDCEEHICFLRNLQKLRSSGSAHRKGGNYLKIAEDVGVTSSSLITVSKSIIEKANRYIEYLIDIITNDHFNKKSSA